MRSWLESRYKQQALQKHGSTNYAMNQKEGQRSAAQRETVYSRSVVAMRTTSAGRADRRFVVRALGCASEKAAD